MSVVFVLAPPRPRVGRGTRVLYPNSDLRLIRILKVQKGHILDERVPHHAFSGQNGFPPRKKPDALKTRSLESAALHHFACGGGEPRAGGELERIRPSGDNHALHFDVIFARFLCSEILRSECMRGGEGAVGMRFDGGRASARERARQSARAAGALCQRPTHTHHHRTHTPPTRAAHPPACERPLPLRP